jgi:hypothetical protein
MYDTLGSKVDTLSETNLMEELEKLAVVKTVAVMQAVNYPAMISEENPVKQPTAHSNPAHKGPAHSSPTHSSQTHTSTANSSSAHSNISDIIEVERDGNSMQADMFKAERDGPTKRKEPITKKAVERTTLAMQAARSPWPSLMMRGKTILMRIAMMRGRSLLPRLHQHTL